MRERERVRQSYYWEIRSLYFLLKHINIYIYCLINFNASNLNKTLEGFNFVCRKEINNALNNHLHSRLMQTTTNEMSAIGSPWKIIQQETIAWRWKTNKGVKYCEESVEENSLINSWQILSYEALFDGVPKAIHPMCFVRYNAFKVFSVGSLCQEFICCATRLMTKTQSWSVNSCSHFYRISSLAGLTIVKGAILMFEILITWIHFQRAWMLDHSFFVVENGDEKICLVRNDFITLENSSWDNVD